MPDKQTEFLEKLKTLQQEFIFSLIERLAKLKVIEQRLMLDWNAEDLEQLYISTHTLVGSSATFGFNRISQTAKNLEHKITPFLQSKEKPSSEQKYSINTTFLSLEVLLNSVIIHSEEPYLVLDEDLSSIVSTIRQEDQTDDDSKLILLIEDDKLLAKNIAEQIHTFGYQVKILHNSLDIKQSLLQETPRALIVDIILPEGNNAGTETIKKIRANYKEILPSHIPILFISCRMDIEAR